jgi:glycosyltransferase involved in cell wall biosynthesis
LLEARSTGLVSIANCGTGSENVIRHLEDGILCGEKTGYDLKRALQFIFSDEFNREKGSNLARLATLRDYDRKSIFKRIHNLLSEATSNCL